uniref:Ras-responsive element-binding protein 1 n=1 Tax=Sphaerodactylus townsendi TaxID=933632 RepID=A0ACB8FCX4_9SAUR
MKIHEKDPNGATTATPPSPLKRRRLSAKRKLSQEPETDREDQSPAKKVVEDSQSGDAEKKAEEEVYRCPVCFKEFSCKYGLETHMEAHPDTSLRSCMDSQINVEYQEACRQLNASGPGLRPLPEKFGNQVVKSSELGE